MHICTKIITVALLLSIAACTALSPQPEQKILTPVMFDDLVGWQDDTPAAALTAFRRSCNELTHGVQANIWKKVCVTAEKTPSSDIAARAYFQREFRLYAVQGNAGEVGLFTGYYVPELQGSLQRGGVYQTALYARPTDMVSVDLGAFKTDLKGQRIIGKVTDSKLVPYDDRAAISSGSLDKRASVLVWVDDPISAFFLQIQGSGRVRLTDNSILPVGYDGTNGHAYVAIGRLLADRGEVQRPVTMSTIRAWLVAHPASAQEVLNANPSYVFFRRLPNDDILGAEGVPLTPLRSLAVDPSYVSLGTPVWLDTVDANGSALRKLMVAQDTGGAIKGVVRGDVFWGEGESAAAQAGAMQSQGRYYLLLPKD